MYALQDLTRALQTLCRQGGMFLAVYLLLSPNLVLARGPNSIADIAEKLQGVVVNISTATFRKRQKRKKLAKIPKGSPFEDLFKDFFDENGDGVPQKKVSSLGSGFVVGASGLIVTNNHVIEDSDEIYVTFPDGRKLKVDRIVGRDKKTDIAVLKVTSKTPLAVAHFGKSKKIRIGDWVMAIGNPFGLGGTVTVGIISAKNRDINSGPYDDFIQTDAAINKGNSGGPLFNMDGEVIGINTAIISPSGGSIGIGFAVPSRTAKNIINQLVENGRVRRGWLGVRIQSLSPNIAESLGLDHIHGALISNILPNSPAKKSGLKVGDVILSFGDQEITKMRMLPKIISRSRVNEDIKVNYLRAGAQETMMVRIEELKEEDTALVIKDLVVALPQKKIAPKPTGKQKMMGMTFSRLTPKLRKSFHIKKKVTGVVVTKVKAKSVASSMKMKPGHVIIEVSQKQVSNPIDIIDAIEAAQKTKQKSVLFLVSDAIGILRFIAMPLKK